MTRGTTPTHIFRLPFPAGRVKKLRITYQQFGRTLITRTEEDCVCRGDAVTVKLTQEETLRFDHRGEAFLQLRILTRGGEAMASQVLCLPVGRVLDGEVLS